MISDNSIFLNDVGKKFDEAAGTRVVFENVTFRFLPGTVYVIKGKSGCGKSTLLSLIGLLDCPTAGKVMFFGHDTSRITKAEKENLRSNYVSFLFQDNNLFLYLTGMDNLRLVCSDTTKINSLATRLGVDRLLSKKVNDLSKGEAARVAICRFLLEEKPVVLLDEPTGNLDQKNAAVVFNILKEESHKRIIVAVSHDFSRLEFPKFTLLTFDNQRLVTQSSPLASDNSPDFSPKKPKKISILETLRFVWQLFIKNLGKSFFFVILACLLSYASLASLSFSAFDPEMTIKNETIDSGLPIVGVTSQTEEDGFLRLWDVPLFKGSDSEKTSISLAFCDKENLSIYGMTLQPQSHQIFIPSFLASSLSITNGDVLKLKAPNGEISLISQTINLDYDAILSKLTKRLGDIAKAKEAALSYYPCVVSKQLVQEYEAIDNVSLSANSLKPVVSLFESSGLTLSAGYFIDEREHFSLSGESGLSDDGAFIAIAETSLTPQVEQTFERQIKGRTFTFIDSASQGCFNPALLFQKYRIEGIEAIPDSVARNTISIELAEAKKETVRENIVSAGFYSTNGASSWIVSTDSEAMNKILDYPCDFYGTIAEKEVNGLKNTQVIRPIGFVLLIFSAVLAIMAECFYIAGLNSSFINEKTLLAAIGHKDSASFWIIACLLGLLILISLLISLGLAYNFSCVPLNHALATSLGLPAETNLLSFSLGAVPFLFFEFVAIPAAEILLWLKAKKESLSEEIKVSKE